jgi:hypothetical protein
MARRGWESKLVKRKPIFSKTKLDVVLNIIRKTTSEARNMRLSHWKRGFRQEHTLCTFHSMNHKHPSILQ